MRGSTRTSRIAAYVATGALVVSGTVLAATPADAVTYDPEPAAQAATWLEGELTNGVYNGSCSYDCGLTIDAGFALAAVGGHASSVDSIRDGLEPNIEGYVAPQEYDYSANPPTPTQTGHYAGSLGKAAAFVKLAGGDPASYGGLDLIAELEALVSAAAPITGRLVDDSSYGDYANTLGHAFAASSLNDSGSPKAADVLDFLLKQQCAVGYFRLYLTEDKSAADQTCEGGRASGDSAPDTDTTALVILMLRDQETTSYRVARALGKAEAWLLGQQKVDGSYGGGTLTEGSNTNSTGLAGWALGELGDLGAARDAAVWVRRHQAAELPGCPTALSDEDGAVALDDAAFEDGRAGGIPSTKRDQWRRASGQATPALQWAPVSSAALDLTGPTGYVKAGSRPAYGTSGAFPGATLCLTGGQAPVPTDSGLGGTGAVRATMPAGTADRTITLTDGHARTAKVLTQVLGRKTLSVGTSKQRVRRSGRVFVTVSGLARGERARIYYKGALKRSATASTTGRLTASFTVGRALGEKKITATGQFSDLRRGTRTIKVVR